MQTVKLAVVGAHLKDMPLHWQLTSREARLVGAHQDRADLRLYAMADSVAAQAGAGPRRRRRRGDRGRGLRTGRRRLRQLRRRGARRRWRSAR